MGKIRHKWTFYIAIMGVDFEGKRYVKGELLQFKEKYFQSEICKLTSDYHYKLLEGFNKSQLKNVGWIGAINQDDIDQEQAMSIFENAGAFNHTVEIEDL